MLSFTEQLRHPVAQWLAAMVLGFTAGIGSYHFILETAHLDSVPRNTYVLKQDLVGRLVGVEALSEIEHLIDTGKLLGDDSRLGQIWLLRTLTFIHEIKLEQDATLDGEQMSSVEKNIRWAMTDPSVTSQIQKTLGILQGLRAAFQARIPSGQHQQ